MASLRNALSTVAQQALGPHNTSTMHGVFRKPLPLKTPTLSFENPYLFSFSAMELKLFPFNFNFPSQIRLWIKLWDTFHLQFGSVQ